MSDQPGSSYLLCPGCGSILDVDSVFCKFCGVGVRLRPSEVTPPSAQVESAPPTSPAQFAPHAPASAVPPPADAAPHEGRNRVLPLALAGAAVLFCVLFLVGVVYLVERPSPLAASEGGKKGDPRPSTAPGTAEPGGGTTARPARPPEMVTPGVPTKIEPLSPSGPGSAGSPDPGAQGGLSAGLTNANVETAVNQLLRSWRLGGSVSVTGVQEEGNSAVADLRFQGFEYAVTHTGQLLRASEFHPPAPRSRNPGDPLPSMEEMFPPRRLSFTGEGKAKLTHYNDGRWVLKEVRWGNPFDGLGVTGTVEIR